MTGNYQRSKGKNDFVNGNGLDTNNISRRSFIKKAIASGFTILAASQLWTDISMASVPKRGGHLRIGLDNANNSDVLDPAVMVSEYQLQLNMACRNFLIEIDSNNDAVPELAESWEGTPDAKEWRFKIRKGVEFHNGKPLTPQDVIATLEYHKSEKSKSVVKPLIKSVENIELEGNDTVVIALKEGNADFPYILSDWHFTILPVDSSGKVDASSGNGTGPYIVKAHEPGVSTKFTRNPNYWKADRAFFDEVSFIAINDTVARQNALVTGEVDVITSPDLKTIDRLKRKPGLAVDEVTSGSAITIPMHVDVAPFNNNDVRLALKLSIDREEILNRVFQGHGTIGNDHPIAPILPYWSEMKQRSYDPEKAMFHLKKAKEEKLTVKLSAADAAFGGAIDCAILFSEQAKKAGINIQVVREPDDGYWSNVWLKKPFCMCYWSGRSTPDSIYSIAYAADSSWNDTHYKGKRFNELMAQAKSETNPVKRTNLYAEMQSIYNFEGGTIIPMFRNFVSARSSKVLHNENMTGHWRLDGGRAAERWWFAS